MQKNDTFIINYDPLENSVRFRIVKSSGFSADLADNEELKTFENTPGLFTLEGQFQQIIDYILENFDGKPEVALRVSVSQLGFNKRQAEFERFEGKIKRFNKTGEIKINLSIDRTGPAVTQPDVSTEEKASEDVLPSAVKAEPIAPAAPKPTVRAAVVGKMASGKTELITGLTKHNGSRCGPLAALEGAVKYADTKNGVMWYEIDGIEFGKENVVKARARLESLIEADGVSIVLYCLSARTGKIEDVERDFIVGMKQKYPDVMLYAVVTSSIDDNSARSFADVISTSTKQTKVFLVLAKEMRTNVGYLDPHGLDELSKYIYGV